MRPFLLAFAVLIGAAAAGCGAAPSHAESAPVAGPARPAQATCPVMGETFAPSDESEFAEYKGVTYWFCCRGCKGKFVADPEKYLRAASPRNKPIAR